MITGVRKRSLATWVLIRALGRYCAALLPWTARTATKTTAARIVVHPSSLRPGTLPNSCAITKAPQSTSSSTRYRLPPSPLVRRVTALTRLTQGLDDKFYKEGQLLPENFLKAALENGVQPDVRFHAGYDHSYYFISSFIDEHIAFHARHLYTHSSK
jgi:hypothetical protein